MKNIYMVKKDPSKENTPGNWKYLFHEKWGWYILNEPEDGMIFAGPSAGQGK